MTSSSSISIDVGDLRPSSSKRRASHRPEYSYAQGTFFPKADKSYFFVEISGDAIEEKLDEYVVGYTRNIHNWSTNPSRRQITSRYLLILKTDSDGGGRELWERVRALADEEGLICKRPSPGTNGFDSICTDWKHLAELVKKAVSGVSFKTSSYRIPELMY